MSERDYPFCREEVYEAVDGERDYQENVWPSEVVHARELSIGDSILLVEEYAAKARLMWSKERYPERSALANLRKVAAIAIRAMQQHGYVTRDQEEAEKAGISPVANEEEIPF